MCVSGVRDVLCIGRYTLYSQEFGGWGGGGVEPKVKFQFLSVIHQRVSSSQQYL
jgi:hypothetical protein